MVRKKIDNRIRVMIENGVAEGHRTMFVIVGNKGRDQVVILHHMLSKATVRTRPSVLWCYKKELGFSSHRKKRMKQLHKKIKSGTLNVNEDDPFELFIAATNIRYCYYKETHKILGNTFGMCVLQDFEALTPNLLARTVETVEGGGIIVILLRSMNSLKQLYTMTMDVHSRYRTESHADVVGRFNERFLLSLVSCKKCLFIDDQLTILPVSSHLQNIKPVSANSDGLVIPQENAELKELKINLQDTQPVGVLVNACKTLDQAKALLKFIDAIAEKNLRSTASLTAARGRGKSAALGLAIASAVAFSYSNIFVTSPSPENLNTLFEFVFKGFDALDYQEHIDYELIQSTNPEFNKAIIRVNVFRDHRQTIQYIHPSDAHKLGQAELVVIDEAAAIPLPLVKKLLGPYLVFLSSTINGYEGTGRSLSLKLINQLRQSTSTLGSTNSDGVSKSSDLNSAASATGRVLTEIQLNESIRYHPGDDVESWLNELLCLDATVVPRIISGCPVPEDCDLYYINRDTLFSYHKASEIFLQRLMALYVASHYKNSPNDLQMMSDAPAHHLFCLLGPVDPKKAVLPEILSVIQVCLEGKISKSSIMDGLSRGQRAAGDLIPWTVAQQFQDQNFPELSGARIVRIASHPDYQGMGYGSRALQLLEQYYSGKIPFLGNEESVEITPVEEEAVGLLEEQIAPRKSLPPLLLKLSERHAEILDYIGVSYGLTAELLRFWKRSGFVPVYLRQTANDLTGEHSCIMLKILNSEDKNEDVKWLFEFWQDFRRRFVNLLGFQFSQFHPSLALNVLQNKAFTINSKTMSSEELEYHLTNYDLKRLELYSRNMADYHLIMDLLPTIAKLYFLQKLGSCEMSAVQAAILVSLGLQHKTVDDLAKELDRPATQLLGLFNKLIRRIIQHFNAITETAIAETMIQEKEIIMEPLKETIDEELTEEVKKLGKQQQQKHLEQLHSLNLSQYSIKGSEDEWQKALSQGAKGIVSMKSSKKRKIVEDDGENFSVLDKIKNKKKSKSKKH